MDKIYRFSVEHPKVITVLMLVLTFGLGLLAAAPTIWPETFPFLHPAEVDTDPENMLPADEPVRVFHDRMREVFALYDMVVLGVVNESHPEGVFNTESLKRIYELTEYAKTLRWDDPESPGGYKGVIEVDLIAPSTVDNVEQGGPGEVKFEWLMPTPPKTEEEALAIRAKAERLPFLNGTVLSDDGKALAIYIPITSKDLSYKVSKALKEKADQLGGDNQYHITGLPVAEDQFGVEMFIQMGISAPLAMLVIFLLMLFFFRKVVLILSPMIVAMVSVIMTMGLLVVTGNTIHIMSSMIPIFIMPIAVLDAIHILSDFFDHYQDTRDRKKTILHVMHTLGSPMLFTSLTTMAGFASLALTPIPPVQIFGLFVAFGVAVAWIWTVTFIPAYVMFIRQESLENFGFKKEAEGAKAGTMLSRLLDRMGPYTYQHAKGVMVLTLIVIVISIYGVWKIRINDNPIKWFHQGHPIRVADKVLNEHFGGTYMGYLAFEPEVKELTPEAYLPELNKRLEAKAESLSAGMPEAATVFAQLKSEAARLAQEATSEKTLLAALKSYADDQAWNAPDEQLDAWDEAAVFLDLQSMRDQVFKQPEVLNYVASLQDFLLTTGVVGKSNSLPDIVKTVYRNSWAGSRTILNSRQPQRRGAGSSDLPEQSSPG